MKVEIKVSNKEVFGIELRAETTDENEILKRFLDKGIKINGYSPNSLQLTFRDLMDKDSAVIMLLEEALKIANNLHSESVKFPKLQSNVIPYSTD